MIKRILITGKNSYIGNQLADWLNEKNGKFEVTKESVRYDKWKEIDFSKFDVVVHVAGIAHQDTKANEEELYYKVNTKLTVELATKAKLAGVKQFIFLSSIIVYGESSKIGETKVITRETIPNPVNFYGNSKLLAEEGIMPLQSNQFNVVVLRPPMIYGKESKGNYPLLSKFAKVFPFFPDINNQRSMIYVNNLTEFIRIIIEENEKGIFFPQNKDYIKTSDLVKRIAYANGNNIKMVTIFNLSIYKVRGIFKIVNKIFGSLIYEKELSTYKHEYQIYSFQESIKITEEKTIENYNS